jgi:hypothetical protein
VQPLGANVWCYLNRNGSKDIKINETQWSSQITVTDKVKGSDNGTYLCEVGTLDGKLVSSPIALLVLGTLICACQQFIFNNIVVVSQTNHG